MRRWIAAIALLELFNIARAKGVIPGFLVKGGFALEFRFRDDARSSRDVDIVLPIDKAQVMDAATEILRLSWSGFSFSIKGEAEEREHGYRFQVNALYQGKDWSTFEVELVYGAVDACESIVPFGIDTFGLMRPSHIPCMTIAEQIAQKLHAVSDPTENRPRDLVDIYLLDTRLPHADDELRGIAIRTFDERGAHPWPPNIALRDGWEHELTQIITRHGLELHAAEVLNGVRNLVARLVGVEMLKGYRYHFLVLSALDHVPNPMEAAVVGGPGYETFTRMTESEGWRAIQFMPYPSREPNRAVLIVLEKPQTAEDEDQPLT